MRPACHRLLLLLCLLSAAAAAAQPSAEGTEGAPELWLAGDVHLGPGGEEDVLAPLAPLLAGASGVVNLEGPVSERPSSEPTKPGGKARLFQHPSALAQLQRAGVRVAGIANAHARDDGTAGVRRTRAALALRGILPAGEGSVAQLTLTGGLRVAVAAVDLSRGGPPPARLASQLSTARQDADVLVVSLTAADPAGAPPRPQTRAAVEAAIAAGARVVVVHGTHALGPVERRGRAVVAWGLGTLASHCRCTAQDTGLVLRVALTREGVARATVLPIRAGLAGAPARPADAPAETLARLEKLGSSPLKREGAGAHF
jgi:poly-gamma-glutamate synthesis protein (capsule biosynthesis protein)